MDAEDQGEPFEACVSTADQQARCRFLRRMEWFRDAPTALIEYTAGHAVCRQVRAGEMLFNKNDPDDFIAMVMRGRIYSTLYGPDGQELIIACTEQGQILGEAALLGAHHRYFTAMAVAPATVLLLRRAHFNVLLADGQVQRRAFSSVASQLSHTTEVLEDFCLHRLESRLARYLLAAIERSGISAGDTAQVLLPPTQSILAAMIHASRPKLNAQLQQWQREGWLLYERNTVQIKSLTTLRRKAAGLGEPVYAAPRRMRAFGLSLGAAGSASLGRSETTSVPLLDDSLPRDMEHLRFSAG